MSDDGGDDGACGLAWAVGVEGADDGDGEVEAAEVGFGHAVGADFGGGVGGLSLVGVFFVDWDVLCGAVDFGGGGDEDAAGAEPACFFEDVEGAGDVGSDVAFRGVVAVGDADEGGEVEDGVDVFHGACDGAAVADVAGDDFDGGEGLFGEGVEPAP